MVEPVAEAVPPAADINGLLVHGKKARMGDKIIHFGTDLSHEGFIGPCEDISHKLPGGIPRPGPLKIPIDLG